VRHVREHEAAFAERGRELAARIPTATLRCVPDAGHLVQEDAPEAIVAALLGFLG
jgi:pimeloyl-ACP methyl ester carboxylesterase